MRRTHPTMHHGCRGHVLPTLVLCLILAGCATDPRTHANADERSQMVVHTSTGQGWRQESPGITASPLQETKLPPRPAARRPAGRDTAPSPSSSAREPSGESIMLSFVDADLQGVVRALARFTGRNFVVDPRVRGQLTLVSETPVDADTAYSMLLSTLRMQ
ncbi:MAG: type II secretion system protein GspD, partial [Candidimonas sp.]